MKIFAIQLVSLIVLSTPALAGACDDIGGPIETRDTLHRCISDLSSQIDVLRTDLLQVESELKSRAVEDEESQIEGDYGSCTLLRIAFNVLGDLTKKGPPQIDCEKTKQMLLIATKNRPW